MAEHQPQNKIKKNALKTLVYFFLINYTAKKGTWPIISTFLNPPLMSE